MDINSRYGQTKIEKKWPNYTKDHTKLVEMTNKNIKSH